MVKLVRGNLLDAKVDALVNTVNTVGVMGKGIALQFKKAFPANYDAYKAACDRGQVRLGSMFVYETNLLHGPRYIINFPTKGHWKGKSKIEDIAAGLGELVTVVRELGITSIAIPPLGCGLGGLAWPKVRAMIQDAFTALPGVVVLAFEPAGAPKPAAVRVCTKRPRMTQAKAAIIGLMDRYITPLLNEYITLLEIQKLAYFQEEAGEPLRLNFGKGQYGPYSDKLRHLLDSVDGHFISGWGDGQNKPGTQITLLPGAVEEAEKFLEAHPETKARFERVTELIEGFETPYGMELLGTVHWVVTKELGPNPELPEIVVAVKNWTKRKEHLFTTNHVEASRYQLFIRGWIKNADMGAA